MSRLHLLLLVFILARGGAAAAQEAAHQCPIDWVGRNAEIEEMLRTAEPVSVEDVGMGVTKPSKVLLKKDGVELGAVFKPIQRGRQKGFWESYEAEIAAYELDKFLGLGMVPPTVERQIGKRKGSLQYFVKDCKLYKEIQSQTPPRPAEWSHQLSVMKMFDIVIMNKDRNAQNFLVDSDWHMVLIDHSRAFITEDDIGKDEKRLPVQFDRNLVEKLRALDAATLEAGFGKLLMGGQRKSLLERRDALLSYLDELVAKQGEARVFFN
jgi:hypothetical protein